MKRFLTVFFTLNKGHLRKDVGMIPLGLAKYCGWECSLAYIAIDGTITEPKYEQHVKLLPISFSNNYVQLVDNILEFVDASENNYDVINFYHGKNKLIWIMAEKFKKVNPNCKIYVKLDIDGPICDWLENNTDNTEDNPLNRSIFDCFSIETYLLFQRLRFKYSKENIFYIPNGFLIDDDLLEYKVDFNEKENIILTAGRIGTEQKFNELLIKAIVNISREKIKRWKIYFAGPTEDDYVPLVESTIYAKYPYLSDHFVFTGNISDKNSLYSLYRKSKIFCLTSLREAFPLVLPEAMFFGNYVITSDFAAAYDLTDNNTIGKTFPIGDCVELVKAITEAIEGQVDLNMHGQNAHQLVRDKFNWDVICKKLAQELEGLPNK